MERAQHAILSEWREKLWKIEEHFVAKQKKVWGGFVDGELDFRKIDNGFGGWGENFHEAPALFTSQSEARRHYRDVRAVEIVVKQKN